MVKFPVSLKPAKNGKKKRKIKEREGNVLQIWNDVGQRNVEWALMSSRCTPTFHWQKRCQGHSENNEEENISCLPSALTQNHFRNKGRYRNISNKTLKPFPSKEGSKKQAETELRSQVRSSASPNYFWIQTLCKVPYVTLSLGMFALSPRDKAKESYLMHCMKVFNWHNMQIRKCIWFFIYYNSRKYKTKA